MQKLASFDVVWHEQPFPTLIWAYGILFLCKYYTVLLVLTNCFAEDFIFSKYYEFLWFCCNTSVSAKSKIFMLEILFWASPQLQHLKTKSCNIYNSVYKVLPKLCTPHPYTYIQHSYPTSDFITIFSHSRQILSTFFCTSHSHQICLLKFIAILQGDKNLIKSNCVDYAQQPIADSSAFLLIMNHFLLPIVIVIVLAGTCDLYANIITLRRILFLCSEFFSLILRMRWNFIIS